MINYRELTTPTHGELRKLLREWQDWSFLRSLPSFSNLVFPFFPFALKQLIFFFFWFLFFNHSKRYILIERHLFKQYLLVLFVGRMYFSVSKTNVFSWTSVPLIGLTHIFFIGRMCWSLDQEMLKWFHHLIFKLLFSYKIFTKNIITSIPTNPHKKSVKNLKFIMKSTRNMTQKTN